MSLSSSYVDEKRQIHSREPGELASPSPLLMSGAPNLMCLFHSLKTQHMKQCFFFFPSFQETVGTLSRTSA